MHIRNEGAVQADLDLVFLGALDRGVEGVAVTDEGADLVFPKVFPPAVQNRNRKQVLPLDHRLPRVSSR